ncbi:hypothetical protein Anapl_09627 [Anas platyrhynchos]|uniref:Uncharacterized protein n=1 Tax=Anas platyrhynchos TaxID=8839 RepID=R0KW13_ANAPL|nr:hypothetical protein Anapl_09627 [Anas platyrhynchos]
MGNLKSHWEDEKEDFPEDVRRKYRYTAAAHRGLGRGSIFQLQLIDILVEVERKITCKIKVCNDQEIYLAQYLHEKAETTPVSVLVKEQKFPPLNWRARSSKEYERPQHSQSLEKKVHQNYCSGPTPGSEGVVLVGVEGPSLYSNARSSGEEPASLKACLFSFVVVVLLQLCQPLSFCLLSRQKRTRNCTLTVEYIKPAYQPQQKHENNGSGQPTKQKGERKKPAAPLCGLLLQAAGRAAEEVVSKKLVGHGSSPELNSPSTSGAFSSIIHSRNSLKQLFPLIPTGEKCGQRRRLKFSQRSFIYPSRSRRLHQQILQEQGTLHSFVDSADWESRFGGSAEPLVKEPVVNIEAGSSGGLL